MQEIANTSSNCRIGILIMDNLEGNASLLNDEKAALEAQLRERYATASRPELKALHPMDSYIAYYKSFGYSYHVLAQLESIIKGKSIPAVVPTVEAMFMAELKNCMLTAGHDLDSLRFPLRLATADGTEGYTSMGGKNVVCVEKDAFISDAQGVISSILRGPDQRSAISATTGRVLYTVYAPVGVKDEDVLGHLSDIERYVRLYAGNAATLEKRIV